MEKIKLNSMLILTIIMLTLFGLTSAATAKSVLPTIEFVSGISSGSEEVETPYLPVKLSKPSGKPVTVNYAVTNGTATKGLDYVLGTGTLTFKPGETVKSIPLTIVNDDLSEMDETIEVTLLNSKNAYLRMTTTHTYTIIDDDSYPAVGFTNSSASGTEALANPSVEIKLSRLSTKSVSVDYAVTGGTALEGTDYELTPGTLTFEPGEIVKSLYFTTRDNELVESDKTMQLSLADPVNAYLDTVASHTYTITDDDPAIAFTASASSINEDGGSVKVAVKLAAASPNIVNVDYAVTGGSAVQGTDYKLPAGTLTFQPSETSKEIAVEVINDIAVEADETILVALSNPTAGHLGPNKVHTITIRDDDPAIDFNAAVSSINEDGGMVTVAVKLTNASTESSPWTMRPLAAPLFKAMIINLQPGP